MKKRISLLILTVCLLCSLLPTTAAAASETGVLQTIQAMGIMVGDENGNMNLDNNVTRAEFATLLARSSVYKDTVGDGDVGYSLFSDVKSGHWASSYIKLAVEQGWMIGYTDGSFRPSNTITLEEACTAVLRLLGYDTASLAGTFPTAQLSKASALGLRDQISRTQGDLMTRRDCMYLFYNLMTAENSSGQIYATTLGYSVTNGEVDYAAVVSDNLSGPYISDGSTPELPFAASSATVYRDGKLSSLSAINLYDVYYYNSGMQTVWVYSDRISGTVSALSPSSLSPTSVTVAGNTYSLTTPEAVYQLSTLGGTAIGDTVMLLLGMDGSVVGVVTGSNIDTTYYGVVVSSSRGVNDTDSAVVETRVQVACTDGTVHTFSVDRSTSYTVGRLVSVSVTESGTTIRTLSERSTSGRVNSSGTSLDSLDFAENVRILDTTSDGAYASITASRLAGANLSSSHVRYYVLNSDGEISDLILNDVTGDTWDYGYLVSIADYSTSLNINVTYSYLRDGTTVTIPASNVKYSVTTGGIAIRSDENGAIDSMRNLESVRLTELGTLSAAAGNQRYDVAEDVQVYLRRDGAYYLTSLSAVDADSYNLTGWYDSFGCPAGGKIRVLIAVEKS